MKTKHYLSSISLGIAGLMLPRFTLALSIVPDKCIQSSTGCDACDIILIFTNISSIIAGLLGSIALLMFIVGGLFWILSNGNEQHIETGKKILAGTITGLAIVMFAWILVNYIVRLANQANTGTPSAQIFGRDWWAPNCTSSVKTCMNAFVGDACGQVGDCQATNSASCSCFRNQKPEGDFKKCTGNDLNSSTAAASSYTSCYCASQCAQLNYREGYTSRDWKCVKQSDADKDTTLDTKTAANVPCPISTDICVGDKK